ncbi:hypothetical protein GO755_40145 [Spirosoma sp. HMF4905]|uniref:Uncharacterized protein n=1 Tax=Spirosoma arboris TaxID=2682092 RepID=A0A7K1SR81_9BACT|nr:hypothetical protein [Spirosoma arboris]MVM36287.1 hypothetical protein [Spirosoma arboris]
MANHRVTMHLLRQILLLKQQGKSIRDIARSLATARNTENSKGFGQKTGRIAMLSNFFVSYPS